MFKTMIRLQNNFVSKTMNERKLVFWQLVGACHKLSKKAKAMWRDVVAPRTALHELYVVVVGSTLELNRSALGHLSVSRRRATIRSSGGDMSDYNPSKRV